MIQRLQSKWAWNSLWSQIFYFWKTLILKGKRIRNFSIKQIRNFNFKAIMPHILNKKDKKTDS